MWYEWKRPKINLTPCTYGQYLVQYKGAVAKPGISLDEPGFLVQDTDYGVDALPFKNQDWIQKKYIEDNFDLCD